MATRTVACDDVTADILTPLALPVKVTFINLVVHFYAYGEYINRIVYGLRE